MYVCIYIYENKKYPYVLISECFVEYHLQIT